MNKKDVTRLSYEKSAEKLAKKFNKSGARKLDISFGLSFLKKKSPSVLEIGCGNGRDAKEILKHTKNYLGVDISKNMINLAKEENPKAKFVICDIEKFKFPEKIDIIFAFASLIHSDELALKTILIKIHQKLEKNGILYLSLKYGSYKEVIKKDEFGTRVYYLYTPSKIKILIRNIYKVIYTNKQHFQNQDWLTIILKKKN